METERRSKFRPRKAKVEFSLPGMAKTSDVVRFHKKQKYPTRHKRRCSLCGRSRAYMRLFGICRLCFRELAHKGELPGVIKASW